MATILDKIKGYCKENSMKLAAFERMCDLSNGTIDDWDKADPRFSSICKIADATKTSCDDWRPT